MLKRRNIEARIVHQMSRWNANTIAGFNVSEGAPSMLSDEDVTKNSKVGKPNDFSHFSGN